MQTERNKDGSYTFWLSREEYRESPRTTATFEHERAIRLMGDCGLRVAEVLDVEPRHITRREDVTTWGLEVVAGKEMTLTRMSG